MSDERFEGLRERGIQLMWEGYVLAECLDAYAASLQEAGTG